MKFPIYLLAFALISTASSAQAQSPAQGPEAKAAKPAKPQVGPPFVVTVKTPEMQVEFAGARAWTFYRILHQGQMLTDKVGFYGTVFAAEGGQWIGTGHTEGGVEKMHSVKLTVDGKEVPMGATATFEGQEARLEKHSNMGPIKLHAVYTVLPDALLEHHRYLMEEDVHIGTLYAFMHPWLPQTSAWLAMMPDGSFREGSFDNNGDFELRADPKWTAIYDPKLKRVHLAWYPEPLKGQGIKTGYWDKTVYHKLYNQIYSHAKVDKGTQAEARIIIRSAAAEEDSWQDQAKALASQTAERFASGQYAFK